MALLLLGKSTCSLCDGLLHAGEDLLGLPALVDTSHPLYPYFDQGFHQGCFARWQHRETALAAVRADQQRFQDSAEYQQLLRQFDKPGKPTTKP
ncbi:MAG: hypothetical protein ACRYG7_20320 [Janthinobacterium lividum]